MKNRLRILLVLANLSMTALVEASDEVTPYVSRHDKNGEYVLLSEDVGTKGIFMYVTNSIERGRSISSELAFLLRQSWSAVRFKIETPASPLCKVTDFEGPEIVVNCTVPALTVLDLEIEPKISRRVNITGGAIALRFKSNTVEKPLLDIHLITEDGKGASIRRELEMPSRECQFSR